MKALIIRTNKFHSNTIYWETGDEKKPYGVCCPNNSMTFSQVLTTLINKCYDITIVHKTKKPKDTHIFKFQCNHVGVDDLHKCLEEIGI